MHFIHLAELEWSHTCISTNFCVWQICNFEAIFNISASRLHKLSATTTSDHFLQSYFSNHKPTHKISTCLNYGIYCTAIAISLIYTCTCSCSGSVFHTSVHSLRRAPKCPRSFIHYTHTAAELDEGASTHSTCLTISTACARQPHEVWHQLFFYQCWSL